MVPNIVLAALHLSKARVAVATLIAATAGLACGHQAQRKAASVAASPGAGPVKLLTARFEARSIRKVEVGDSTSPPVRWRPCTPTPSIGCQTRTPRLRRIP